MTADQIAQQLRQELTINERLVELLRTHAKNIADETYRKTRQVTDHSSLLALTSSAAGVENFVNSILPKPRS